MTARAQAAVLAAPARRAEPRDRDRATLVVLLLAGGAWLLLWAWTLGGRGHHGGSADLLGVPQPAAVGLAWLVMVVAMMLPLALGLLGAVRRLVSRRTRPGLLVALAGAAFLAPWVLSGQVAQAATVALDGRGSRIAEAGLPSAALAGAAVAAIGAFQLSPLKSRSLAACRSPVSFAARRWRGGPSPAIDVMRIGGAYGMSCVACCWGLMAMMLAAGAVGVFVMMPVAAVMVIERLTPWGAAFARAVGGVLIVVGASWAVLAIAL